MKRRTAHQRAKFLNPPAPPKPSLPLNGEDLITLDEASHRYPSHHGTGKRMHRNTLKRRILKGVKHPVTGAIVKMEATREGRRLLTSWEAVARWEQAMNSPGPGPTSPPQVAAAKLRRPGFDAGKALEAMGA